jgi:hypothetical protein
MPWGERGWSRCACTNGGLLHDRSESGARQRRYTLGNRSGKTLGFDCRTNENEAADDSRVDVKPGTFLWRWLDLEVSQGAVYGAREIFDGDGLGTSSHDCSFPSQRRIGESLRDSREGPRCEGLLDVYER